MRFFLAALLFVQVRGLEPGAGIVSGSIQIAGGGPAAGVRVAAIAVDDPGGTNLLSLAETDSNGRYRLINIPEGRYYIVAGRISSFIYYPGGSDVAQAKEVKVEAAKIVSTIDFNVPSRNRGSLVSPQVSRRAEVFDYMLLGLETNIERKLSLLLDYQKNYPTSDVLPEVFVDLMDVYSKHKIAPAVAYTQRILRQDAATITALIEMSRAFSILGDVPSALRNAEEAVLAAGTLKARRPSAPYDGPAWESWSRSYESKAAANLERVRKGEH